VAAGLTQTKPCHSANHCGWEQVEFGLRRQAQRDAAFPRANQQPCLAKDA